MTALAPRAARHTMRSSAVATFLAAVVFASPAEAQTSAGEIEIGVGVRRSGALALGSADANETTSSGGSFRLFRSESRLEEINAVEARIGIRLTPAVQIEATGSYGESDLVVRLSSDVEGIPDVSASEAIQRFTVEGALTLDVIGQSRRARPFVAIGGGYVRDVHDGQTLVESGAIGYMGGGLNLTLRSSPAAAMKAAGVRLDGRVVFGWRGVGFDDDAHTTYAVGASMFMRF
jgi:hypothetical protein